MLNKAKKATERRLKKIKTLGFKTDSTLKQIIEGAIKDVYEIPFKQFGKTGECIAFKTLHHIAEFGNHEECSLE